MSKIIGDPSHMFEGNRLYHPRRGSGTVRKSPDGEYVMHWDIDVSPDQELEFAFDGDMRMLFLCDICGREVFSEELAQCNDSWCADCAGCRLSHCDVTARLALREEKLTHWIQPNGHKAHAGEK